MQEIAFVADTAISTVEAIFEAWRQLEIDHLIPKTRGGDESPLNKVVSCMYCNRMKANLDPRGYDPNAPIWTSPPDQHTQETLIETARQWIERARENDEVAFRLMLEDISSTQN